MPRACIGLGANLGDAAATLQAAARAIAALPDTTWLAGSRLYRSRPVDASGPDFHNAVALVATGLTPHVLLDALQAIEAAHGRARPYRNAPRTLDLDLLTWGDVALQDERLTLPHPRMGERAFVLMPLLDVVQASDLPSGGPSPSFVSALAAEQGIERLPQRLDFLEYR